MYRDNTLDILNSDFLVDDINDLKERFELSDANIKRFKVMTVVFFDNLRKNGKYPSDLKSIDVASIFVTAIEKFKDVTYEISKKDGSIIELKSNATFIKCLMDAFNAIYFGRMDAIDMLAQIDEMESSIMDEDYNPEDGFGPR